MTRAVEPHPHGPGRLEPGAGAPGDDLARSGAQSRVVEGVAAHQMPRPGTRALAQLGSDAKLAEPVRFPGVVDPLDEPPLRRRGCGLRRRRERDGGEARKQRKGVSQVSRHAKQAAGPFSASRTQSVRVV